MPSPIQDEYTDRHDLSKDKKWRLRHPEKSRQVSRDWQAKSRPALRAKALETLGGKCIRCGIDDPRVLQVDHINGGGGKENRKIKSFGIYNNVISGKPGYQLLCANCNWIKRYECKEFPQRV